MAKIKADFSSIITMAGPVKFYQRPCPYGKKVSAERWRWLALLTVRCVLILKARISTSLKEQNLLARM